MEPPPMYNQENSSTQLIPNGGSSLTTIITGPQAPTPLFIPPNPAVGPKSTTVTCPQCRCRVETSVRYRSTTRTHLACCLLTSLCCCCLPYCMNTCRNANHFCPMCGTYIGTYQS